VDELVTGVNLALGNLSLERCPAFDSNTDIDVTVAELITAVNHALAGCSEKPELRACRAGSIGGKRMIRAKGRLPRVAPKCTFLMYTWCEAFPSSRRGGNWDGWPRKCDGPDSQSSSRAAAVPSHVSPRNRVRSRAGSGRATRLPTCAARYAFIAISTDCNPRSARCVRSSVAVSTAVAHGSGPGECVLVREIGAVVDTVALLGYLGGAARGLGRTARRTFDRARAGQVQLAVPTVCLFEVSQLEERGRISLRVPFERWCDLLEQTEALLLLPLARAHVSEARSLPTLRDPFDRLIAGTAVALGVPLVTPDARIAELKRVTVIW
jgi:PIN domain nuclease of toxin-antitoxin system